MVYMHLFFYCLLGVNFFVFLLKSGTSKTQQNMVPIKSLNKFTRVHNFTSNTQLQIYGVWFVMKITLFNLEKMNQ